MELALNDVDDLHFTLSHIVAGYGNRERFAIRKERCQDGMSGMVVGCSFCIAVQSTGAVGLSSGTATFSESFFALIGP